MRFYHSGAEMRPPIVKHPQFGDAVKVPDLYCPKDGQGNPIAQYAPCKPGSIVFGIQDVGFFVVEPGGFIDMPAGIPLQTIKAVAPELLTEEEAVERGVAVKQPQTQPKAPDKPAK